MTKLFNRLKNIWQSKARGNERTWQQYYYEEKADYTWLKKTVTALAIFALVYGAQISDTRVGREVTGAVRQILANQTDFAYWTAKAAEYGATYWPVATNWASIPVLKQVQATISRPADPLMYMTKPVDGQIVSPFGWRNHPVLKQEMHEGIDIAAASGTSIKSAANGKVKVVTDSAQFGKTLIIEHGQNIETMYGHLGEVVVKEGDSVSQGQLIARVGKPGIAIEPILYFEVRENGKAIDPMTRIKGDFLK